MLLIIPMPKITKGHLITQNLDGTEHLDCLYRISLKALAYNYAGRIPVCAINFLSIVNIDLYAHLC